MKLLDPEHFDFDVRPLLLVEVYGLHPAPAVRQHDDFEMAYAVR